MLGSLLNAVCRARRVPSKGFKVLTSKQAGNKFYKGRGAMKTGINTRYGKFLVLPSMMPKYEVPDLTGFDLKPYVARYQPEDFRTPQQELAGRRYTQYMEQEEQHKQARERQEEMHKQIIQQRRQWRAELDRQWSQQQRQRHQQQEQQPQGQRQGQQQQRQ